MSRALADAAVLVLGLSASAVAQNPGAKPASGPYDDPRVVQWSRDYRAGRIDSVFASVERDLRSTGPHPYAAHVWSLTAEAQGTLKRRWGAIRADDPLRKNLGALPEILNGRFVSGDPRDEAALLDRFPAARASEIDDPWALEYLRGAAINRVRVPDAAAYLSSLLSRFPDFWLGAVGARSLIEDHSLVAREFVRQFQSGGAFALAAVGAPARDAIRLGSVNNIDRLDEINTWSRAHPRDAAVVAQRAAVLTSLGRFPAALADAESAYVLYPFRNTTADAYFAALVRAGKARDARAAIANLLRGLAADSVRERAVVTRYAATLRDADELGLTRLVLDSARVRWPDAADVLEQVAELEIASERHLESVEPALRVAAARPTDLTAAVRSVSALREAKRFGEAMRQLARIDSVFPTKAESFYYEAGHISSDASRPERALAYWERAVAEFPLSAWMMDNLALTLARNGNRAEAIRRQLKDTELRRPTEAAVARIREWGDSAVGPDSTKRILDGLLARFPLSQPLWSDLAQHVPGASPVQEKLEIWRRAIAANPGQRWPWDNANSLLVTARMWDEAETMNEQELIALAGSSVGARNGAWTDFVWTASRRALAEHVPAAQLERALRLVDSMEATGSALGWVHRQRSDLLAGLGRKKDAADEFVLAARAAPDDGNLAQDVVIRFGSLLGCGPAMYEVRRYVDRNPYSGERLSALLHKQTLWCPNAVEALHTVALLKERAPNADVRAPEAIAWGQLGLAAKQYESDYGIRTTMSNSDRYVEWFNAARLAAQAPDAVPDSTDIDFKSGVATIFHADGRVERRASHPLSGKVALRQLGNAWVRFVYDSLGDRLTRAFSSDGNSTRLEYDDRGHIAVLTTHQGTKKTATTRYTYNDRDKPTRIAIDGIGVITVTYHDDGSIDKADSPQGRRVALRLTEAFETLTRMLRLGEGKTQQVTMFAPPDPVLDSLRGRYSAAQFSLASGATTTRAARAALALAAYLAKHTADDAENADEATGIALEVIAWALGDRAPAEAVPLGVQAAATWYDLIRSSRRGGVDAEGWARWTQLVSWLDGPVVGKSPSAEAARQLRQRIAAQPVTLLSNARWFPRSFLRNSGYWRRYRLADFLPADLRAGGREQAVLVRRNHDVVVGTNKGLAVLRHGYWEWFAFDEALGQLSSNTRASDVEGSSNVLSLAEGEDSTLWIGTANGLVRVTADYAKPATVLRSMAEGLPTPRIDHLVTVGGDVLAGTERGLVVIRNGKASPVAGGAANGITFLREAGDSAVLVATSFGLSRWRGGRLQPLADGRFTDALWREEEERLFVLQGRDVLASSWDGESMRLAFKPLPDQQNIVVAQQMYGLALLPLDEQETGVAVLTDQGMSVFYDEHFEAVDTPDLMGDRRTGVRALSSRDGRTYLVTSDGVYAIERGQVMGDVSGEVRDILTPRGSRFTFVARGDAGLQAIDHANVRRGARTFSSIDASHLAQDAEGRLIANDGLTIVRFSRNSTTPEELFAADQTLADEWKARSVSSILVASDGTIWVSAGASVFRWRDGGAAQEFSVFKDPRRFPVYSEMVSRVIETVDKHVWVVASDESHLQYRGTKLRGGVFEYRAADSSFRRLDDMDDVAWFLTGYTPIDSVTAIGGTVKGFVQHRGERYASFQALKNPSYLRLRERTPLLWLGTGGARLGSDVWLFGSAGGLVGYRAGQWFLPDRLNRMLPDDHLSQYGSRTVHAVATDEDGRVYAGTDRGLLIYESGGGDAMSFLVTNHPDAEEAFRIAEQQKLEREADALLSQVDPKSEVGQQIARVRNGQQDIARLRSLIDGSMRVHADATTMRRPTEPGVVADSAGVATDAEVKKLRDELDARERAHAALMTQLEKDHLSLFQMLQLNPLDLLAERKRLQSGQAVVQFLPTDRSLYIQVVTADNPAVTREVSVARDSLFQRIQVAVALLRSSPTDTSHATGPLSKALRSDLNTYLAWLYDKLIRPIEGDLAGRKQIYIVPAGVISYVPFAALVRSMQPKVEYANATYTFGYLPSMYMLSLVLQPRDSSRAGDALVMGDPDGSLPSARIEADSVHSILHAQMKVQLGDDASYANFKQFSPSAQVLHFATHARLQADRPGQSYVLLAGRQRLTVADIMMLDLHNTNLAVLSACETGLGGAGLEYATLARAFAHAKVPSIVATLWRVNDVASDLLIREFYHNLDVGDDVFAALAKAQRKLAGGGTGAEVRDPYYWASFIPMGKPETLRNRGR